MEFAQKEDTSLGLESYDVLGFNSLEEFELEISKLTKFRPEFKNNHYKSLMVSKVAMPFPELR